MTSEELNQRLLKNFPHLEESYQIEINWQDGDATGSQIVYSDIFTPFVTKSILSMNDQAVKTIFSFVEEILQLNDVYCTEVITVSVLENIQDLLQEESWAKDYMGNRTRELMMMLD
ncbi:DUF7674 family protein [Listeria costaricensis]|uniref:DUF7674 family protein n=1 Tax=Listeria costaricensis TaxID=2026604 RepID=UPI000C0858AB|nr:hypothetical protein [Listeria costaricensis]